MITNFGINRFKSIEHFDERLTPLNVFVGTNNSGKSSVLQALHFAVSVAQSRRLLPDQQAAKESSSFSLATQQLLYTPLQDVMYLGRGGVLAQSPDKEIQVQIKLDTNDQGQIGIRRGKNRNIAITAKGAQVVALLEDVSRPFSVYVPGLAGIAKTESFVSMGMLLIAVPNSLVPPSWGLDDLFINSSVYPRSQSSKAGAMGTGRGYSEPL